MWTSISVAGRKIRRLLPLSHAQPPLCMGHMYVRKKGLDRMGRKRELTPYGKEVKHRLIELNKTQVELAEEIGTSKQYLGKILFGERAGTMYLDKIAQVLQLD